MKLFHTLEEFMKDPLAVIAEQHEALSEELGQPWVRYRLYAKDQLVVPLTIVETADDFFTVGKACAIPPPVPEMPDFSDAVVLSVDEAAVNGYKNVVLDVRAMLWIEGEIVTPELGSGEGP